MDRPPASAAVPATQPAPRPNQEAPIFLSIADGGRSDLHQSELMTLADDIDRHYNVQALVRRAVAGKISQRLNQKRVVGTCPADRQPRPVVRSTLGRATIADPPRAIEVAPPPPWNKAFLSACTVTAKRSDHSESLHEPCKHPPPPPPLVSGTLSDFALSSVSRVQTRNNRLVTPHCSALTTTRLGSKAGRGSRTHRCLTRGRALLDRPARRTVGRSSYRVM